MRAAALKNERKAVTAFDLFIFAIVAAMIALWPASARAMMMGDAHVHFDPKSVKIVGETVVDEIHKFFKDAELAMEAKDIDRLMSMYSDSYEDGPNSKEHVREMWKRIFAQFDKIYTRHNMRFSDISQDKSTVVISCSGVLMGSQKDDNFSRALDHWLNNDHVLVKENGAWKLKGTVGKKEMRFWLKNPSSPLV